MEFAVLINSLKSLDLKTSGGPHLISFSCLRLQVRNSVLTFVYWIFNYYFSIKRLNSTSIMSQDSDDDWETADFDARIEEQSKIKAKIEEKSQKTQQQSSSGSQPQFFVDLEDGNYMNNPKTQNVTQQADNNPAQSAGRRKPVEVHVQAYPFKDIQSIRSYAEDPMKFDQLYIKTFGEFERFIESHGQKPPEILVNLLIIDVTLLESPFRAHNKWLLSALVKEEQFWTKLMNFIEGFFEEKWKDHTFMLKIDVHGFFKNLTFMLSNLIVENVFEEKIKSFYESIVDLMKRYPDNPHNNVDQIEKLLGVYQNSEDIREKYSVSSVLVISNKFISTLI